MNKEQKNYLLSRVADVTPYNVKPYKLKEPRLVKAARKKLADAKAVLGEWEKTLEDSRALRLKEYRAMKEKVFESIHFGDETKALELVQRFEKEFKS